MGQMMFGLTIWEGSLVLVVGADYLVGLIVQYVLPNVKVVGGFFMQYFEVHNQNKHIERY